MNILIVEQHKGAPGVGAYVVDTLKLTGNKVASLLSYEECIFITDVEREYFDDEAERFGAVVTPPCTIDRIVYIFVG